MHDSQARPGGPPPGVRPEAVQLRARRSPRLIAAGLVLVVLGGLGAGTLFSLNGAHREVVAVTSDLPRGHVLTRDDLTVVDVPSSLDVDTMPAEDLDDLVGRRTAVDLTRGAFPVDRHFEHEPLPDGEAVVGLLLKLGRVPSTGIVPGAVVQLVGVAESAGVAVEAVVVTAPQGDGVTFSFDVRVPEGDVAAVASAMAADQLVVVLVQEA